MYKLGFIDCISSSQHLIAYSQFASSDLFNLHGKYSHDFGASISGHKSVLCLQGHGPRSGPSTQGQMTVAKRKILLFSNQVGD